MATYREEIDAKRILQTREICRDLPQACSDFLRHITLTTGTFTRLAYAIDLRTFVEYLHRERITFTDKNPRLWNGEDLARLTTQDLTAYTEYLTYYFRDEDQKDENGRVVEIGDTLTLDKVLASLEEFGYFLMLYCPAGSNDLMESHYEPVKSNTDLAALQELDYKASMRLHQMADRDTVWVKGAYIGAPGGIELGIMKNGDGSYS